MYAANEVLHKWLSRQDDTDESSLLDKLREVFHQIKMTTDFIAGKNFRYFDLSFGISKYMSESA